MILRVPTHNPLDDDALSGKAGIREKFCLFFFILVRCVGGQLEARAPRSRIPRLLARLLSFLSAH